MVAVKLLEGAKLKGLRSTITGQVWVRQPGGVRGDLEQGRGLGEQKAHIDRPDQRGEGVDCGAWLWLPIPAGGSRGCFRLSLGCGEGGPLTSSSLGVQDSDGDKSDDLVVDVSNEVSTDGPRLQHARFGVVSSGSSPD